MSSQLKEHCFEALYLTFLISSLMLTQPELYGVRRKNLGMSTGREHGALRVLMLTVQKTGFSHFPDLFFSIPR